METSRSPSGLSKPQKSIGYSNDFMEISPRHCKSPSPPSMRKKDDPTLKNLVFWNRNEKIDRSNMKVVAKKEVISGAKNDAQILKEISTIIKKIQNNNGEKNKEAQSAKIKQPKINTLKPNYLSDKISEESTKTTFENNFSEKSPKTMNGKGTDAREEKNKMALEMIKIKNNLEIFPDKSEIAKQFFNYKTQIDFFRNKNININELAQVLIRDNFKFF